MLRPSYSELMQVLNKDPDLDNKITSRYAIVIATAKRARMLIDGAEPKAAADTNKAVSIAVMEMRDGVLKIIPNGDETDELSEGMDADSVEYLAEDFKYGDAADGFKFEEEDDGFDAELETLINNYNNTDDFEEEFDDDSEELDSEEE